MAVDATIELATSDLLVQEPTIGTVRLTNDTGEPLRELNPHHAQSLPAIELTHLTTGAVTRCVPERTPGAVEFADEVEPGATWKKGFVVPGWVQLSAPGLWELRAHHTWDGGEALSEPVRVHVRPASPRALSVAPAQGVAGGSSLVAWVDGSEADPRPGVHELWLTTVMTSGEPWVPRAVRLAVLDRVVAPTLSIPPGVPPRAQWIAWIEGGALHYVLHRDGVVHGPARYPLAGRPGARIVPPLLQDPGPPAVEAPGASLLLAEPAAGRDGTRLTVLHLSGTGQVTVVSTVDLAAAPPSWAQTAYGSDGTQTSFLLSSAPDEGCDLHGVTWPTREAPAAVEHLARLPVRALAADLCTTRDDATRGVILGERTVEGARALALYPWLYQPGHGLAWAPPVPLAWPEGAVVGGAVARINGYGSAFALLRGEGAAAPWVFFGRDGHAGEEPLPAASPGAPADILFRHGDDPVVMYTEGGRGLLFAKP